MALLAAWGVAVAVALWTGRLHVTGAAGEPARAPVAAAPSAADVATVPTPAPPGPTRNDTLPEPTRPLVRHRVCTATGTTRILRIANTPLPRYLVHCGGSVELIGFESIEERVEPRRLAHFEVRLAEPGLGAEPGGLASGDLDGDGSSDLLIGSALRDDRETLGGGRIHWLRGTGDGIFAAARRLSDAPASDLALRRRTADAALGLLALQEAEARLGASAQLLFFADGLAKAPAWRVELGPRAARLAAVDVDLDGVDETFVLAGFPATLQRVTLDAAGKPSLVHVTLDDAAPRELAVADLSSDGHADLLVLGDKLSWLSAGSTSSAVLVSALPGSATARDLQLLDATGDGRVDAVIYAHPKLWLLEQAPDGSFAARELYTRRSTLLGTRSLRAEQLDTDPDPELLLFGSGADEPGGLDLVVIAEPGAAESLNAVSQALRDAPLSLRANLP